MSEWISVADKLPDDGVVVALQGGDIERLGLKTTAGYYDERYGCFVALLEDGDTELCAAGFWMHLPDSQKCRETSDCHSECFGKAINQYFCSYMSFKNNSVFGYGDMTFDGKVADANELLGDVKDYIIDNYYAGNNQIKIVITALNKI